MPFGISQENCLDHSLWSGFSEIESHTHLFSKMLKKMKIKVKVNYTVFLKTMLQRMQGNGSDLSIFPFHRVSL